MLARLLNRPSVLVIGGYDVANMPEIGYGHQRGGLKKWISRWTIYNATSLLTFSQFSKQEIQRNVTIPGNRIRMAYIGFNDPFGSLPVTSKEKLVLTTGNIERGNLYRKGHLAFAQAAALLPHVQFVLAGAWRDETAAQLIAQDLPNLIVTGWLEPNELLEYYRRASVYVQASQHEGFGMAVAEAMLAGCIPVVTRVGALPEVVGDTGIYLESQTPEAIASGIQKAMGFGIEARAQARERVLSHFPLQARRLALWSAVDEVLS
jgi:glycosyltransferase involved in cell wall biosynthesis